MVEKNATVNVTPESLGERSLAIIPRMSLIQMLHVHVYQYMTKSAGQKGKKKQTLIPHLEPHDVRVVPHFPVHLGLLSKVLLSRLAARDALYGHDLSRSLVRCRRHSAKLTATQ